MRRARLGGAIALAATSLVILGGVPAGAVGQAYTAEITTTPALPAPAEYGTPDSKILVDVDFGTPFEAITRLCFRPVFEGDLLDQGESFSVFWESGGFGFGNSSTEPIETHQICISAIHDEQISHFLDGVEQVTIEATPDFPDFTTASFTMSELHVRATAIADESDCTILGTDGDDTLRGTAAVDIICALGGDDTVYAYGGDDTVLGGPGKDTIYGGSGYDSLFGGPQGDTLFGGSGNDVLLGGPGWDALFCGDGNDYAFGHEHRDRIYGQAGRDWIILGPGDNQVGFGGADDDYVRGGDERDRLYGGPGSDTLNGVYGDDQLYGGPDDDWLYGGPGDDWLCGQAGNDTNNTGGQAGDAVCRWDRNDG